ncbi:MAG: hypothetical protein WCD86_17080 [Ktedonobacteraceae bacterium]
MLTRILSGIVIYGVMAVFLYLLARMSIWYEMSKHPDPPYRVALPFLKVVYTLFAATYVLMVVVGIVVLRIP